MRIKREYMERIEAAVRNLQRGRIAISECEAEIDRVARIADRELEGWPDEKIALFTAIKRKGWRMLLEATDGRRR